MSDSLSKSLPLTDKQAEALLDEHNSSPSLQMHGRAVRAVLRRFARLAGENEAYWAQVGLLHDIDYEQYPDQHCEAAPDILREAGYDDDFIYAVISHGYGLANVDAKPELYMEKVLYATDELTGLITAAVYMRPDRSVNTIEVKSVRKKFKNKKFAAGVDRDIILRGAEMLDIELNELIAETIAGMREAAEEIGLAGEATD
jgi:predicted hydrolase (HD superfamily)